jgi:hypothetical protein
MKAKYLCEDSELYMGLNLLAKGVEEEIEAFAEIKPMYTLAWVEEFREQIKAAQLLPDETQRKSALKGKRIELKRMTRGEVNRMMGSLRSYISECYDDRELRKVKLAEAGFGRLREAMWYDWEVLKGMLQVADEFIKANEGELMENDNMPVDFWVRFKVMRAEAEGRVMEVLKGKGQMKVDGQTKVRANNVLFRIGMRICMDGKVAFKMNEAKRKRFVWEAVMEGVTPAGASGLKGWVKVSGSFAGVPFAEIRLQQFEEPVMVKMADEEGNFFIKQLKKGVYDVELVVDGVVKKKEVLKLTRGRVSYRKWVV